MFLSKKETKLHLDSILEHKVLGFKPNAINKRDFPDLNIRVNIFCLWEGYKYNTHGQRTEC